MDNSLLYRKMCYKAVALQEDWRVQEGDVFVLKASYCTDCEENLCDECLRMDNEFIIAGNHYDKYYLFNPTLCVRGDGCRINSTSASILVKDKELINDIQPFNTHVDNVFWLPRQDQLQKILMYHEGWNIHDLQEEFTYYLGTLELESLEQYWLSFVMDKVYYQQWNGEDWV